MTCPKCKAKYTFGFGNFCCNCGNKLREKCPECEEMEPIGKLVCKKSLEAALEKRHRYKEYKIEGIILIQLIILLVGGVFCVVSFWTINSFFPFKIHQNDWGAVLPLSGAAICIFLIFIILNKLCHYKEKNEQECKKEFLQKFPAEAEILRKGGIIK